MKSLLCLFALSAQGFAALAISMPGSSESAVWTMLNNSKYTAAAGFPAYGTTTNLWPGALAADSGSTAGATFNKLSGGGYFASASLYDAGTPGTFVVADTGPSSNLSNLVFQADVGSAFEGSPLLTINGGGASISPGFSSTSVGDYSGGFGGPPAPSVNHAWQWDLSAITEEITSYQITWTTTPHGTIYQMNLQAGDTFLQAVPEPSSALLGAAALGFSFIRRRRA